LGVKLVKIDAIVVLSYILWVLVVGLMVLSVQSDRVLQAYYADPGDTSQPDQYDAIRIQHTSYNSLFADLNPLALLLLCNLSLLWDKRPAWMRRDHATKRDTEGGAELFL
ncbi:hypothetical protein KIPB_011188, partial [Kipferlia bialata]